MRDDIGYPIEVEAGGCTQTIGERMHIDDEKSGVHVYYTISRDCVDPADEGREEVEAAFTVTKGDDGLYGLIFLDYFKGTGTGTCSVEGDELHCEIPPSLQDIYIRAD